MRIDIVDQDEAYRGLDVFSARATDGSYLNVLMGPARNLANFVEDNFDDTGLAKRMRRPRWSQRVLAYISGLEAVTKGKGMGTKLMEKMTRELRRRGAEAVFLHASADDGKREALHRFYRGHGFRFASVGNLFDQAMPVFWKSLESA